jgi:hypothetical protein
MITFRSKKQLDPKTVTEAYSLVNESTRSQDRHTSGATNDMWCFNIIDEDAKVA